MQTGGSKTMALLLAASVVAVLGCAETGPSGNLPEAASLEQAKELATAQDALILMDFYTDW